MLTPTKLARYLKKKGWKEQKPTNNTDRVFTIQNPPGQVSFTKNYIPEEEVNYRCVIDICGVVEGRDSRIIVSELEESGSLSTPEMDLFIALGVDYLVSRVDPVDIYNIAAKDAFIKNKSGPAVQSLRRCLAAITNRTTFRGTKEFDDLIRLKEELESSS